MCISQASRVLGDLALEGRRGPHHELVVPPPALDRADHEEVDLRSHKTATERTQRAILSILRGNQGSNGHDLPLLIRSRRYAIPSEMLSFEQ